MPVNKNALTRYNALDRCFGNPGRKFFIENLIEACNAAVQEQEGPDVTIIRRQVFTDIKYMESEKGYAVPLNRIRHGKRTYYRYSDHTFSIVQRPLNDTEYAQLREAMLTLTRIQGLPQFQWIEEMVLRLQND
jgi:hypothetical protein